MPLHGEAEARQTYVGLTRIPVGSRLLHRCTHRVLGTNCVQKTVPIMAYSFAFFEPRLLEALDHPHITPIREAQFDPEFENFVTFVMPWYEGGSTADALAEGHRFSLAEAINVSRCVLDALVYLHTRMGYAHRDVKPSNVLLDEARRQGYLADFEHAASFESDGLTPAVATTTEYMAPECAGEGRQGAAADVYGVGVVLFEMLNGRLKWEDLDRGAIEKRVMEGRRALPDHAYAPSAFAVHVPEPLVSVVRRAISRRPSDRYPSAADFLRALNGITTMDWRHESGDGATGMWKGSWPPHDRVDRRDHFRVESRVVGSGPSRGKRRLTSLYRRSGATTWRRAVGIADRDVDVDDAAAIRRFFKDVSQSAAHRRPAR